MGKNNHIKQRRGGRTNTKTYPSGVDGMKEHIFNCGEYKDTARFNETQKEFSNYILQSSEKSRSDVAKTVHILQSEDLKPTKPSEEDNKLTGLEKDVWANYQPEARHEALDLNDRDP